MSLVANDKHFFQTIFLKISGNVHNGKNRVHFFLFLGKMKDNLRYLRLNIFEFFFAVHVCLTSEDYQIFTVHRIENREFESAEIF
jgi:hypothetical protein